MPYQVEFSPKAERQFRRLPRPVQVRLAPHIDALNKNPRPHGVKKLINRENMYRLRVGDYRVIYTVEDRALLVLVAKIGDRKEVYR